MICKIIIGFSMVGDLHEFAGYINLESQEISQIEDVDLNSFEDETGELGLSFFSVEFEILDKYYRFNIIKTDYSDTFEISPNDKSKFLEDIFPILLENKLKNQLPEKKKEEKKRKI